MSRDYEIAIAAWQEADRDARQREATLALALAEYSAKRGPAVSDGLMREVAQARARANAKLSVAIATIEMKPNPQKKPSAFGE
ncbi:MAG: hypothetical protein ACJ8GN_19090 [Longimicrobiaceae bacterium]